MFPQKSVFKMYYRLFNFFAAYAQKKQKLQQKTKKLCSLMNIIKLEYKTHCDFINFYIVNVTTCPELKFMGEKMPS